jgi:hypothetical protein
MQDNTQVHVSNFLGWIEANPELSRPENDPLTQRIAKLIADERECPHLWFKVAVFVVVDDVEFVEDQLMGSPVTWPSRDDISAFSPSFACGRIWREFDVPDTADNAYRSCFVLCHLWGEYDFIEHCYREDGDWSHLCLYPCADDIEEALATHLGAPGALHVSRSAMHALNRVVGRPLNMAWTAEAARAAVERLAAAAPPHLAIDAAGVEFALRRYEACRGWEELEDDEAA